VPRPCSVRAYLLGRTPHLHKTKEYLTIMEVWRLGGE
jgi:hypothetical protein